MYCVSVSISEHIIHTGYDVSIVIISSTAIVVYDYITTISDEIRLFWKRPFKLSGGVGMYFFIRYALLLSNLCLLFVLSNRYDGVQVSISY